MVLKDDLMKLLWPDSFVEEANLTQNIFILRKALGESGRSYRYISTVPGRGYRFATKVAEVSGGAKEPVRSPAIENQSPSAGDNASGRRRLILGVGAFILLLVAGGLSFRMPLIQRWLKGTPPSGVAESSTIPIRRSVAVLGFQNVSGQLDEGWLSTAISEMLSTELAAGEELRMISGEDVARMKQELPWKGEGSLAKDTLVRIHRDLGFDFLVLGSYTVLGEKVSSSSGSTFVCRTPGAEKSWPKSARPEPKPICSICSREPDRSCARSSVFPAFLRRMRASCGHRCLPVPRRLVSIRKGWPDFACSMLWRPATSWKKR